MTAMSSTNTPPLRCTETSGTDTQGIWHKTTDLWVDALGIYFEVITTPYRTRRTTSHAEADYQSFIYVLIINQPLPPNAYQRSSNTWWHTGYIPVGTGRALDKPDHQHWALVKDIKDMWAKRDKSLLLAIKEVLGTYYAQQ